MGKTNAVVVDFEAYECETEIPRKFLIHTIALIPVTLNTGKMSQLTMHTEKSLVIKITDVLNSKYIKQVMELNKGKAFHLNKKHENDTKICNDHGIKIRQMRYFDAVKAMNKFTLFHGGILMSHNWKGDLQSIVDTQNFVKGRRIIKNKLSSGYPNSGMYDKNWMNIKLVCTVSLFCNRCPKMKSEYEKWLRADPNGRRKGEGLQTLESFTQFIKNDTSYHEKHAAVQDAIDLFNVIKYAYECERGPILDTYGYMAQPKWIDVKSDAF